MSRKNILFSLFVACIILSCSSDEAPKEDATVAAEITTVVKEVVGAVPGQTMAVAIEGMSCEMNCVSSVKKTLAAVPGISNIDIHFSTDNEIDTAFFDVDETKVQSEALIEAIHGCNNGLYKVNAVEITKTVSEGATLNQSSSSTSTSEKTEKTKYRKFNFPSLLDLIKTVGL